MYRTLADGEAFRTNGRLLRPMTLSTLHNGDPDHPSPTAWKHLTLIKGQ